MKPILEILASMQSRIDSLEDSVATELRLNMTEVREFISQQELQTQELANAQAEAIVNSAVIIAELEETKAELEAARLDADAANRSKSEFLANMSHEIRTPMTAILGFSEVLTEAGISDEEKDIAIQTIQRNGSHLLEIINDILDLSKVESGKLEIEWRKSNPIELMSDVQELLRSRAEQNGNRLEIEVRNSIPQFIKTDPTRIKQALVNLVGNAIKFTNNGSVKMVVECRREQQMLDFHVVDSGIGMSPSQLERVFKPFCQADSSTTRRFGGTGLGLTITKQMVELLYGSINVESKLGDGTTFTISIPTGPLTGVQMVSGSSSNDDKTEATTRPENSGDKAIDGRVLVVEDGKDNQRLISFTLKKAGADVTIV